MTSLQREVLLLYKQIFQISRTWVSANATLTATERAYIETEARKLFKKNKNVSLKRNTCAWLGGDVTCMSCYLQNCCHGRVVVCKLETS